MLPAPRDEVHTWFLDPALLRDPRHERFALSLLDAAETGRLARLQPPGARESFLATRLLARLTLARYLSRSPADIAFTRGPFGKPALAEPDANLRFNLSNTNGLVACAITGDREIGVDVEAIDDVPAQVAETFLAPPEQRELLALPADAKAEAFFAFWTLKEAFLKACGVGFTWSPAEFAVRIDPPSLLPYGRAADACDRWSLHRYRPTPGHRLALCVEGREPPRRLSWHWVTAGAIGSAVDSG